jgi:hypothetical protein
MLPLAFLSLAIYRGQADYRQNLFLQGQATLVRTGQYSGPNDPAVEGLSVGAGAVIDMPNGSTIEYIAPPGDGLAEQRTAIENDIAAAKESSLKFTDNRTRARESGDALRMRASGRTANLATIVPGDAPPGKGVPPPARHDHSAARSAPRRQRGLFVVGRRHRREPRDGPRDRNRAPL